MLNNADIISHWPSIEENEHNNPDSFLNYWHGMEMWQKEV